MIAPNATTATADSAGIPSLDLSGVVSSYGDAVVLRGVSISIRPGSVAALLGPNGAGKTTLLRTIAGLMPAKEGSISVNGTNVGHMAPHRRSETGVCLVPEGRGIFTNLSVRENLQMLVPPWNKSSSAIDRATEAFPVLGQRMSQLAGSLSGGEQQMLAVSRAFMTDWTVVLFDEISMGLAPKIVDELYAAISRLAVQNTALLIVEQYVSKVLGIADTVHLLDKGSVVFEGNPSQLNMDTLAKGYFGAQLTSDQSSRLA